MSATQAGIGLIYNSGTVPNIAFQRGGASFLSKANDFLKKNKVISKVAKAADFAGIPHAGKVAIAASKLGYGVQPQFGLPTRPRRTLGRPSQKGGRRRGRK